MGICISSEEKKLRDRNQEIDNQLKKDKLNMSKEVKMLLLGAGESGKSTILKQMRLIHSNGYTKEEREAFKEVIYSNTIQSMKVILEAMKVMNISVEPENEQARTSILEARSQVEADVFPVQLTAAIKQLWKDSGVKQAFERSREYQLNDSAKYYFEGVERLSDPSYSPSDQDILRSRIKTTGIIETSFKIGDLTYKMFDVGGQRSERKKWIHCFENVTAIVFLAALSEYDQVLAEDETTNRMQEALTLFESICNSRWFTNTSIILFLNKKDLFEDKLPKSPLQKYFPEYEGNSYDEACEFILNSFLSSNKSQEKHVYAHFTCATDTTQIKFVMAAVNDIVVQNNLRDCGFM